MPTPHSRHRRYLLNTLAAAPLASWAGGLAAQPGQPVLRVGPGEAVRTLAEAASRARPGMRIEVMAGDYLADVAVWRQDDLQLKAVGGRVRLIANGAHAQGKGIFVTAGQRISIEGFDFMGAQVPDTDGAGIRLEAGSLTVRDCSFSYCEMGLLTSNDPRVELLVEGCEFAHCRRAPGKPAHLLYIGRIGSATVRGSYFHHAQTGHLLKSRAARSQILYNRLTDETGGAASYELEFPDGGVALVIGNLIQQSAQTENPHLIAFGAEGYKHPRNELWLVHNTLVDDRPSGGIYLRAAGGGAVHALNNLLVGGGAWLQGMARGWLAELVRQDGRLPPGVAWDLRGNVEAERDALVQPSRFDYRPRAPGALKPVADAGPGPDGQPLRPTHQYRHPRAVEPLPAQGPLLPGALQPL